MRGREKEKEKFNSPFEVSDRSSFHKFLVVVCGSPIPKDSRIRNLPRMFYLRCSLPVVVFGDLRGQRVRVTYRSNFYVEYAPEVRYFD